MSLLYISRKFVTGTLNKAGKSKHENTIGYADMEDKMVNKTTPEVRLHSLAGEQKDNNMLASRHRVGKELGQNYGSMVTKW